MKKFFALFLTIALIATMSAAFATEANINVPNDETEITFNVDPTYTITIPAKVELNMKTAVDGKITYENDYTITAEAGVRLKKLDYIEVTIMSDYKMKTDEGAELDYTITKDGKTLVNRVVATFDTDTEKQTSTIHISADDPDFAGEYKDTVTFELAVKTWNGPI